MKNVGMSNDISWSAWLYRLVIVGLFFTAYSEVLQWMYERYLAEDSYYSHGFLIPFITVYLIWLKRAELNSLPPKSSYFGVVLIVFSILARVFGEAVYVFSISGFSILLLVFGISLFLYGGEITKSIVFPLALLAFMFPLPSALITMISFPLKVLVAQVGAKIASLMGIPLLLEGFIITIPQGELLVGNPCSGLRSLISFLVLGALFAYFSDMSDLKKYLLFFLAIPIAIISNLVRVPVLIYCSYNWGLESAAPDTIVHTGSGMVVFVLGIALLLGAQRVLGVRCEK